MSAPEPAPWPRLAIILGVVIAAASGYALVTRDKPSDAAVAQAARQDTDQDASCRIPADFPSPWVEHPRPELVRDTPVTRYTLSLSWSPGFCATHGRDGDKAMQCSGEVGSFGFILHGLWPESDGSGWPQYCAPTRAIARETLSAHLCMTPSPQLLQHEWTRHGTCMAATPEAYFDAAQRQYDRVHRPDLAALARGGRMRAGDVRRVFVAANPGLPMNAVMVSAGPGGWLDEVRLCLDRRFAYRACPAGEHGTPDGVGLRVAAPR